MKTRHDLLFLNIIVFLFSLSCSKTNFSGAGGSKKNPSINSEGSVEVTTESSVNTEKPLPVEEVEEIGSGNMKARFVFSAIPPAIDFVFIVDNSVSMESLVGKVTDGFKALLDKETFPDGSLVAIMTTQIAKEDDLSVARIGYQEDPGFLKFVTRSTIENLLAAHPGEQNHFPIKGCENEWFSPKDLNADGQYCFLAAFQTVLLGVGIEAGLHAYKQLLQKNEETPIFRKDAATNIIYVSDAHDPGANYQDLIDNRPTFSELKEMTEANTNISAFRVHAIAPASDCTDETNSPQSMYDKSYYVVAEASGGTTLDICTETDFSPLMQKIVQSGSIRQKTTIDLGKKAAQIVQVSVNSQVIETYSFDGEQTITIENLPADKEVEIMVVYTPVSD